MSPKTIFITGASGHIGSALTRISIANGYSVRGLSRSETSDEKIKALGAVPVRGALDTHDVLAREAASADIICFLSDAFNGSGHQMPFDEVTKIHCAAVDAIAGAIVGSKKPLVIANGALITTPNADDSETNEDDPDNPNAAVDRGTMSRHCLTWTSKGINVSMIRLAPWVYGHGASGVALMIQTSLSLGSALVVSGGKSRTSVVHVDDAARMFLQAAEAGDAAGGHCFNAVSDTTVTFGALMGEISNLLGVPVKHVTLEEASASIGPFFADFLQAPCRGSSDKAKKVLGWEPKEIGLLEDIRSGSYVAVAEHLKSESKAA